MAQDLWEESELVIRANLASEPQKPYTGTVDLHYIKNGEDDKPLATQTGLTLKDNQLEQRFKLPKVDPDAPNYAIKVIALHGEGKATRSDVAEATVWPKTVTIHTRTEVRPNESKVPIAVVQNGTETPAPLTGDDGNCTAQLLLKAPYTLKALAPYSLVSDETLPAKLREHKLTVVRPIIAMFVAPDVSKVPYVPSVDGGTGRRQYVNLVTARNGQDAFGHEVLFEVCANPRAEGRAGDRIYVQAMFSRASSRNNPLPTLMNSPAVSELKTPADDAHTGWVVLDADGGTAKFKVNLGLAGGDDCAVAISGRKDDYTDATITLVNWRKLFYQLRYPAMFSGQLAASGDFADDLQGFVTARLGQAFIEYENVASIEFPDADATISKGNGTLLPAAYLKDNSGGNVYVVSPSILDPIGKFRPPSGVATLSRTICISLCERSFSGNVDSHSMAPLITSVPMEIPSPKGYLFDPPTERGRASNMSVAGYEWEAVVEQKHEQPTMLSMAVQGAAAPGRVMLADAAGAAPAIEIAFAAKEGGHQTTLPPDELTRIGELIARLLSDKPSLRRSGNKLRLVLSGDGTTPDGDARLEAVMDAATSKFTSLDNKVSMHPGLDEQGQPRKGPMELAWLSFKDYETILVKLPASPAGTAAELRVLPGDFVGATETAHTCKVRIKFDFVTAGSINGNSGGGYQILKLRDGSAAAVSSTICHELGHSMGITIVPGAKNDRVPPGMVAKHIDSGGTSYFNGDPPYTLIDGKRSIHKGSHCAYNVPGPKISDHKFQGWKPGASSNGCIMWGSGSASDRRPAFCPTCLELIKARRLEDVRSKFETRAADQG